MCRDHDTHDVKTGYMGKAEAPHERGCALEELQSVQTGGQNPDNDLVRTRCRVVDVFERADLGTAVATLHVRLHSETCPRAVRQMGADERQEGRMSALITRRTS